MMGLSFGHLLIIAVVVLIFGRKRLPEVGSALGSGIAAFKRSLTAHSKDRDRRNSDDS